MATTSVGVAWIEILLLLLSGGGLLGMPPGERDLAGGTPALARHAHRANARTGRWRADRRPSCRATQTTAWGDETETCGPW